MSPRTTTRPRVSCGGARRWKQLETDVPRVPREHGRRRPRHGPPLRHHRAGCGITSASSASASASTRATRTPPGEDLVDAVDRILAITGEIQLVHCNDSKDGHGSGSRPPRAPGPRQDRSRRARRDRARRRMHRSSARPARTAARTTSPGCATACRATDRPQCVAGPRDRGCRRSSWAQLATFR